MADCSDKSDGARRPLLNGSAAERWWLMIAGGVAGLAATTLYLLRKPAQWAGRREEMAFSDPVRSQPLSTETIARLGGPAAAEEPQGPVHFEATDIGCAGGGVTLLIVASFIITAAFSSWWLFSATFFRNRKASFGAEQAVIQAPFPPQPRLEPLIVDDTRMSADYWAREHDRGFVLDTYGSTEDKDYVHIPLEQAMRLAVKKLPVRREGEKATANSRGLFTGGEANSGRVYRTSEK